MADPIKRALTRRRVQRGKMVSEEPNEKLVLGVKFAIGMTACLSVLGGCSLGVSARLEQ